MKKVNIFNELFLNLIYVVDFLLFVFVKFIIILIIVKYFNCKK